MADIEWSDVTDIAGELANAPGGMQDAVLIVVNGWFEESKFGGEGSDELTNVRALMAAHLATVLMRRGATGQVTSSSAGGLSRSFSTMMTPSGLGVTSYGSLLDLVISSKANLRGTTT